MEPAARRNYLREQLSGARDALDRGAPDEALAAVERALRAAPDYLAAQVLKERILRQPVRSPAPAAVPEAMPPQTTEAAAAGLASGVLRFESRIRARRIGKRAEAARAVLASGRIRHAHAAIDEIATIDPEHPAHALLLMELAAHASRGRRRLPFGPVVAAVAVFFGSILVARSADSSRVSPPHASRWYPQRTSRSR